MSKPFHCPKDVAAVPKRYSGAHFALINDTVIGASTLNACLIVRPTVKLPRRSVYHTRYRTH